MYSLIVVEVDDVVPRRFHGLPNLYVGLTTMTLDDRFRLLEQGKGPGWIQGRIVGLREDLSLDNATRDRDEARTLRNQTLARLRAEGYTVNRITSVWTVYVIELDPAATRDPGKGYLYVGETMKTPERRFEEHLTRARNRNGRLSSSVVAKHGRRLRMDLAPGVTYFDRDSAKRAEAQWAEHLRAQGYTVRGGH